MSEPMTRRSTTISDVAREAGVSRAAVSKVIRDAYGVSPQMRKKVETAIEALDYRPSVSARAMRGSTYTLGVEIPNVNNQFFMTVINGATAALKNTHYQLIIAPDEPDEDRGPAMIQVLADRQVDGIVAISPRVPANWLEELAQRIPLVMLGSHRHSIHYDTVVSDDELGASLAVRHLYNLGHRRIVHLTKHGSASIQSGLPQAFRRASYQRTMWGLGLEPEIVEVVPAQDAARVGALELLRQADGPVGIFAAHDELALGVLDAIAKLGLDASQASVIGYDDINIAAHPLISLTSLNQSGPLMGEICVRLLLERIEGRREPAHEVVVPKLIARKSTASPYF